MTIDSGGNVEFHGDVHMHNALQVGLDVGIGGQLNMGGPIDMGSRQIKNLGEPNSADDAATKGYVDAGDADWTVTQNDNMYSAVSGYVGIGTVDPDEKLEVAGTVQMTGFKMLLHTSS